MQRFLQARVIIVCLLPLLTTSSTKLAAQSNSNAEEDIQAPQRWGRETIALPPGFAPDMQFKGVEHLRFAPGMMQPKADSFLCYVMVFQLSSKIDLTAETLNSELLKYYRGLCRTVMKGKQRSVETSKFSLTVKETDHTPKFSTPDASVYLATLHWTEPFATLQPQILNLEITTWTAGGKTQILALVSPQAKDAAIWTTLRSVRDDYLKRHPSQ